MADDDDVPQPLPAALPPLAVQKAVRRVPGSFDGAEISPVKEHFDAMPSGAPAASDAANPPTVVPEVLKPSKSPAPIPPVIESSFADGTGLESTENADLRAEQAVRTHLQDIESSFAAPLSPVTTTLVDGFNDTFLLDRTRPAKSAPALSSVTEEPHPEAEDTSSIEQRDPAASVGNDSLTQPALPPVSSSADVADIGNTTASLETLSSSPTAAAAARTVSRALSSLSSHGRDDSTNPTEQATKEAVTRDETPPQNLDLSGSSNTAVEAAPENLSMHSESSVRRSPSGRSLRRSTSGIGDAAHTPGHALRQGKRPKYLRSRNASQRSSTSSFLTNNDSHDDCDSDVTVGTGADYALQSGGAVPALGARRSLSNILSRSISMGSMASGIEDLQEAPGRLLDNIQPLETLDEVDTPRKPVGRLDDDLLQTPKPAANGPLAAPTDTVIARHVRNVQVPESLAKEYKSKSGLATPRRPSDYSVPGTAGRHAKSLTLKEQSSTIERLSKENFDLKLKVMFLSDRLDKLSEEGVKEMISENVELRTSLAMAQRDNKALRRRVKELEKQLKEDEHRPSTARSGDSSNDPSSSRFFDQEAAQEREEELIYLRERVEEYVVEIERLRKENMAKEAEKRKMAEVVKTLGERTGESLGRQEEADVWKDLLEQETARREQADEDNRKLQDEIFKLKQELSAANAAAAAASVGATGLHHTTNIYNITKKRGGSPSRSTSGLSGDVDGALANAVTASTTSTLVEELRRESEQLRHENAELRREVGAQTSMLTSRNREKERLYQEIEDLKMAQRRGAPAPSTVDSLLERSASRAGAHERSHSRTSGTTRNTGAVEDDDREELENKLAEQRDKINEVRLQNQELQRELDACMEDFEAAIEGKRQTEELAAALQEDLDAAMNDLVALQAERDEALREQADMEAEFEALRKEAQDEIDALENEAEQRNEEINRLQLELNDRSETFDALQEEMRKMSEALLRLEDDQDSKLRRIQQLEQELSDATRELEELETKLIEANEKANRLGVQQESSQGEIAFLREEQEADKIRIGDLEAALANAEQSLREERERTKELEQRLVTERRQREILATREKAEVQQFVNELNRENSAAKDEARRLRKNLSSREIEAAEWKERLLELENNLREALGDLHGTRSSLLKVRMPLFFGPDALIRAC